MKIKFYKFTVFRRRFLSYSRFLLIISVVTALFVFFACESAHNIPETEKPMQNESASETSVAAPTQESFEKPLKEPEISEKELFINGLLAEMSVEEKVGQMFMCALEPDENGLPITVLDDKTIGMIDTYKIGGVIYFAQNIDSFEQTVKLSDDLQRSSTIPLLIGVDEEGGRVTRITKSEKMNIENTPSARTIGDSKNSENAYIAYETIANNLKTLGINLCFAPVADLSDTDYGVIGDRAFGSDADAAGEFVIKAAEAFKDNNIISVVKHFPGHGTSTGDTHDEEILSDYSLKEILSSHIIPFEMAANAGVPVIMLSHITVQDWGKPTSMSEEAVRYIREKMGFNGIIITDSFRMGAITNYYTASDAAKNAVIAGVDIVLMPEDLGIAIRAVLDAVNNEEISETRIDDSVKRILSVKYDGR